MIIKLNYANIWGSEEGEMIFRKVLFSALYSSNEWYKNARELWTMFAQLLTGSGKSTESGTKNQPLCVTLKKSGVSYYYFI